MNKFWIIAVNNVAHNLNERFTSYTAAEEEAIKRAKESPNNEFLILELVSYVDGESTTTTTVHPVNE